MKKFDLCSVAIFRSEFLISRNSVHEFLLFPMRLLAAGSLNMALGSTQTLTEISTRNLPGVKRQQTRKADNLTIFCEPIVQKMWDPRRPTACYKDSFTLLSIVIVIIIMMIKCYVNFAVLLTIREVITYLSCNVNNII
jgi:hypothetical protein